jgi:outer membrane protein
MIGVWAAALTGVALPARAQTAMPGGSRLTLAQARDFALQNNPRIRSAASNAGAAAAVVKEARSAEFPNLWGNVTSAGAQHSTVLSAGALQTSSLYSRFASGIGVTQLVTDFGRTGSLVQSAAIRAQAQNISSEAVRQQVLLDVEQAYFQALGANAVHEAAQAAVNSREVTLRQIRTLAESSMRSTLDVRFAEVSLSQAQLDLYRAENNAVEAQAHLSAAMGLDRPQTFILADEPMPAALAGDPSALIQSSLQNRPDLRASGLLRDAAHRFAEAEARLNRPSVAFLGAAGVVPAGDPRLPSHYSAAGVNVTIPVLNGGLFSGRRAEAEQRAAAAESDAREVLIEIVRQVQTAWLEANTAARRIDVTVRLVAESAEALRLAQTRYDNSLGSIVELSQAQLNQTAAQIENANARYEYLSRRVALDYATGVIQ